MGHFRRFVLHMHDTPISLGCNGFLSLGCNGFMESFLKNYDYCPSPLRTERSTRVPVRTSYAFRRIVPLRRLCLKNENGPSQSKIILSEYQKQIKFLKEITNNVQILCRRDAILFLIYGYIPFVANARYKLIHFVIF